MIACYTVRFHDNMPISEELLNDIRRAIEDYRAVKNISMVTFPFPQKPAVNGELDDELSRT